MATLPFWRKFYLFNISSKTAIEFYPKITGLISGWSPATTCFSNGAQISCIGWRGSQMEFQNAYFKIHVWNDKVIIVLYQSCFMYAPGMKDDHALGVTMLHSIVFLNRLVQINKTSGKILLGDPLAKVLKWGQKMVFLRFPKCIC